MLTSASNTSRIWLSKLLGKEPWLDLSHQLKGANSSGNKNVLLWCKCSKKNNKKAKIVSLEALGPLLSRSEIKANPWHSSPRIRNTIWMGCDWDWMRVQQALLKVARLKRINHRSRAAEPIHSVPCLTSDLRIEITSIKLCLKSLLAKKSKQAQATTCQPIIQASRQRVKTTKPKVEPTVSMTKT